MSVQHWRKGSDKKTPKYPDNKLCKCNFVNQKYDKEWPRFEPQTLRREAGDKGLNQVI
jgi:hypothetical protein